MTDKEIIEVVKAHSLGSKIEFLNKNPGYVNEWTETEYPAWDFVNYDYRVKPVSFKETTIQHFLDMGIGCLGKEFCWIDPGGHIRENDVETILMVGKESILTDSFDELSASVKIAIME